ncbi:hypothetical protein B2J93_216 [Marssonina coronariae]|uniref:Uncharacterized protein n=1 Tax=Diplocarpon coronariae TaxID=2795749 RepID=A0A218YZZ8_9HELO|nr:hypothetical protein B2J93_216 [Marssonina coronariae]
MAQVLRGRGIIIVCLILFLGILYLYGSAHTYRIPGAISEFAKQVHVHLYLFWTRDSDGDSIAKVLEEEPQWKKRKPKLGVPESVKTQCQQAIESSRMRGHERIPSTGS